MSFVADLSEEIAKSNDPLLKPNPNWKVVPLGKFCHIISGYPFPSSGFGTKGIPVIRIRDVVRSATETRFLGEIPDGYFVKFGDLLIGMDGDFNSNIWKGESSLLNQRVCKISTDKNIVNDRFLYYFLPAYLRLINAITPSVTVKHLSTKTIKSIPFPVPAINDQNAIVSRIDTLFSEIDEGEAALARAREGLETYRRSLLKAAVTGELTASWRAAHPARESGAQLLARILADRRTAWRADPAHKGKTYKEPAAPDTAGLPELPEGWVWASVEMVGDVHLGRQRTPAFHFGEHMRPYLRVANVMEGHLDLTDVKKMNFTPNEFKIYSLKYGDILLNEGQSPELLGRPSIYREEIDGCCFQNTLIRFRAARHVSPEYAEIVFIHYMKSGRFIRESRITTNLAHLSHGRFAPMEFPLPPLEEQQEIVSCLQEAAQTLDSSEASSQASTLRQSILAAAFRGDLAR